VRRFREPRSPGRSDGRWRDAVLKFSWEQVFQLGIHRLLSQSVKDTLCGTKVVSRRNCEVIAANRACFGEIDRFGDFDLIVGAANYN
jgi:hypothetical protein